VHVLESKGFQSTILALIVLDMALVITEVALDGTRFCNEEAHLEFPNEHYEEVVESKSDVAFESSLLTASS
jgi:hypothetical protein